MPSPLEALQKRADEIANRVPLEDDDAVKLAQIQTTISLWGIESILVYNIYPILANRG